MKTWSVIKTVKSSVAPSKKSGMLKICEIFYDACGALQKMEKFKGAIHIISFMGNQIQNYPSNLVNNPRGPARKRNHEKDFNANKV
jgi:hypothetical protein